MAVSSIVPLAPLFALLLSLSCTSAFEFFYFVRQWPTGVCRHSHKQCHSIPKDNIFTVHGLWPDNGNGSYPKYCDPEKKFDPAFVQDMLDGMRLEWPSYYGPDNGFWAHEWEKHGTCSAPYLKNEEEYFSTIMKLKEDYDLLEALNAAHIKPSDTTVYSTEQIEDAVKRATGARPRIMCSWTHPYALREIWMCISTDFKPIDCAEESSCSEIIYPPPRSVTEFPTTKRMVF